jgi:hypothetical protein
MRPVRVKALDIVLGLVFAGSLGCEAGSGTVHVEETPGCDPLVGALCAFPFPSMQYLEEDSSTATGYRVALTEEALPANFRDSTRFLERFNQADGFSIATPWLTIFPEAALDGASLPSLDDLDASARANSSIQVLDRDTGERYPVWAELDFRAETPEEQTLIIRPMRGLALGRRVAVVITDALRNEDGSTPVTPPAFAALRDGRPTDSQVIEGRREEYEQLFDFLAGAGVDREHVLLAWEAVTFSDELAVSQLEPLVRAATDRVATAPPTYTVTACYSHDADDATDFGCLPEVGEGQPLSPLTWRRLVLTAELPSFLGTDGYIETDESGEPVVQGTFEAEVVVNVPASLRDASAGSAPVVVFGHGLLRDPQSYIAADVDINGQMTLAEEMGAVFVGTRWVGLSSSTEDLINATSVLSDPGSAFEVADTLRQGIVNQILMAPFATEVLASDPLLAARDGSGSIIDGEHVFYTGISLGGIFGTTFMAFSPYVATGVLHVPGSGFVHMMAHSVDFALFQELLNGALGDRREQQLFMALAQRMFDVGDPVNYVGHLVENPLTPLGPKSCLWQCAVGDSEAMWYGCELLVRTGGFPLAAPVVSDVFGLEPIDTPTAPRTSGMQQFDPGMGLPSLEGGATEAHTAIRRNPEVHLQTIDYLDRDEPGRIVNHCGGPCVIDPVPEPDE